MDIIRIATIFRKHYLLILAGPLLSGLAALIVSFLLPPVYEAEVQLAIVKSGAVVNFDPKYQTVSELDATNIDQTARRKSLTTLAKSATLAGGVIDKIGDRLKSADRTPTNLLSLVDASIDGDLIKIKVRTDNAQTAALIANTWAALYRDQVNQVYGEETLTPSELQGQADDTRRDYDAKERALVDFLANNPIDLLSRQISQKQQRLADLVTLENKLDRLLADATALKGKLSSGTVSNGRADELAALLLEASAFSTWSNLPVSLQIPIDQLSAGASVSDQLRNLDTLIAALQQRRTLVQTEAGGTLQQEINALQAQLEQATAKKQDLTRARDISSSALSTLSNKIAEVQIAAQSKASVVRIAAPALEPTRPISNRILIVVLSSLLGLVASSVAVAGYAYVNDNLSTVEQFEQLLELPILASVAAVYDRGGEPTIAAHTNETFRLLRYRLQAQGRSSVLLITSALPVEGQSVVALNLAKSYVQVGKKVTLLNTHDQPSAGSSADTMQDGTALSELLRDSTFDPGRLPAFVNDLRILHGGAQASAYGLLESEAFERLLSQCQATSDVVLLDMPALLCSSDALLAARLVDAFLLLVEANRGSRTDLLRAKKQLQTGGAKILGIVLVQPPQGRGWRPPNRQSPIERPVIASRNGTGEAEAKQADRA